MKKDTMNLITFVLAVLSISIFIFTLNILSLGFGILFGCMFIVDSFWVFLKKFFIKNKLSAIGGDQCK